MRESLGSDIAPSLAYATICRGKMDKKIYLIGIIAAVLFGIVLLALGVIVGRFWFQPRVVILNPTEGNANTVSVTQVENSVTVVGSSAVKVKPEIARLFLGIEICDDDANKANQEINRRLATVTERLQKAEVPKDSIVPSQFSLYPRYSDYTQKTMNGFCATNKLMITTDNLQSVSGLLDAAIEAGVTNVYGVVFTVKDTSPVRQEAIRLAYADAEQQAQQLSNLLGQPVRRVVKVDIEIRDNLSSYIAGYTGGGGGVDPQEGTLWAYVTQVYAMSKE